MIGIVEYLGAEVGQIVPGQIDSALVPIKQADRPVGAYPDVLWPRVAMDDRDGTSPS